MQSIIFLYAIMLNDANNPIMLGVIILNVIVLGVMVQDTFPGMTGQFS